MRLSIKLLIYYIISILALELVCRLFLHLGNSHPEASVWNEEKWIEGHSHGAVILAYTIDRYDSLLGWTLKENLVNHKIINNGFYPSTVNSNSRGCRGSQEYTDTKQGLRILFIGDSYIFGECVNDTETIPYLTQSQLPGTEVINMGVHGYGNDQQYLRFVSQGLKYHPDIVILGYTNIDPVRNHLWFRDYAKPFFELKNDSLQLKGVPVRTPESYLRLHRLKSLSLIRASLSGYCAQGEPGSSDPLTQRILDHIYQASQSIGAELIVLYLPMPDECKKGIELQPGLKDSLCINHHLTCVSPVKDIHGFLQSRSDPDADFKCHYSVEVNMIIAKSLSKALRERVVKNQSVNN